MTDFGRAPQIGVMHGLASYLLIDRVVLKDDPTSYTSEVIDISDYRYFSVMMWIQPTGSPTDVVFEVEIATEEDRWHQVMNGPFGDLRYTPEPGNQLEAVVGKIMAKRMRIIAVATGTDASNRFQVTVRVVVGK